MGLFDLFKKKQPAEIVEPAVEPAPAKEPYLGDLEKTGRIFELIEVPAESRDQAWQAEFLELIVLASFRCDDPQLITGPDGFPYFQLMMPKPAEAFQCYVIDHMKDDFLLEAGYGVVINPDKGQPDWVLSYGDILNLKLSGAFYTSGPTLFSAAREEETIRENEKVLVGQPSELILPEVTRAILREFLVNNGVKFPKVMLMSRTSALSGEGFQDLAFNLTLADFGSQELFRSVMQHIAWFLPRHYSFVAMEEGKLGGGFMPL